MGQNSETIKLQRGLKFYGYKFNRQNGSHMIYKNDEGNEKVVNLKANKMVVKRILKELAEERKNENGRI